MHVRTRRTTTIVGLVALAAASAGPTVAPAGAESPSTVTVTTTADTVDANLGDGTCADAGGQCSLRAAIQQHGGVGQPLVTIELPPGRYELTRSGPDDSISTAGSLDVYGDVVLTGDSPLDTVIDGNGVLQPLHVGTEGTLELSDVTVTGGSTTSFGGAVIVDGQLFAERVRFVNNVGGQGGAVGVNGGSVSLDRSEVAENHATNGGGGIVVAGGSLLLTSTTVSANTTADGVSSFLGGGISAFDGSSVDLRASTLSGNEGPELHHGGAPDATSTGIALERTVIGDADPQACDLPGGRTVESRMDNLVTDTSCRISGSGDMVGLDPLLGPLAFYGGTTRARYPLPGSPAIDTATHILGGSDQRGASAPIDGDGVGGATNDAGAIERDAALPDVPHAHPFFSAIAFLRHDAITTGYGDGTFRPSASISRQAFAAFLFRYVHGGGEPAPCVLSPFPDVPESHPFCGAIAWMVSEGIAGGYDDGMFRPSAPISRQAMAAFLYRATMGPSILPCLTSAFPDVPATHPFCPQISWMVGTGVTGGYDDGTFRPGALVTRQAMAAFLQRLRGVTAPAA